MKRDKEKMIRDDKQDFHFVGFQEENADTIPSEIPCQYSFLSLVRHFVCFEKGHRHGDHVMVGEVDHCFCFFQNWHTPELVLVYTKTIIHLSVGG